MLTLVGREAKQAKSIIVGSLKPSTLVSILQENLDREATVYTDEAGQYKHLGKEFAGHDFILHGQREYGRDKVYTNTVESFCSIFRRGMKGVYQHCGKQHLHRYAAEFDFRYNNRVANGVEDLKRSSIALRGAAGKRLTYARPH